MDGRLVVRLYIGQVDKNCSWLSYATDSTTAWHGKWLSFDDGTLVCLFDFGGREAMRKHVVIYEDDQ